MTDLSLDENFDVSLNDRNDLSTVEGRSEFEQSVAVKLTAFMYGIAGDSDFEVLKQRVRYQVSRVARSHDILESIEKIIVERHPDKPGTIVVELVYSSADNFDINLNL